MGGRKWRTASAFVHAQALSLPQDYRRLHYQWPCSKWSCERMRSHKCLCTASACIKWTAMRNSNTSANTHRSAPGSISMCVSRFLNVTHLMSLLSGEEGCSYDKAQDWNSGDCVKILALMKSVVKLPWASLWPGFSHWVSGFAPGTWSEINGNLSPDFSGPLTLPAPILHHPAPSLMQAEGGCVNTTWPE